MEGTLRSRGLFGVAASLIHCFIHLLDQCGIALNDGKVISLGVLLAGLHQ